MPFGVYVHIPFCARRCDYCDFATWTDRSYLVERYVDACVADLGRWNDCGVPAATSVFFGGGTPSLLEPRQLLRILGAIETADGAEVTVECNPDSVDQAKLAALHGGGVNRVSFGVQSMVPHVLAALGRTHDPHNVERAMAAARSAGFSRVNVDLVYGAEGESLGDWQTTLDRALGLRPTHVSAYALTIEAGTPLARRVDSGEVVPPDDDEQADKYLALDDAMVAAGLEWYEISNWAHPGDECRHNLLYWHGGEYLGVGCAAHGHTGGRRWWTVRSPDRYVEAIEAGCSPVAGGEELGFAQRADEALALALRTRFGAEVPATARVEADELVSEGLLAPRGGRVVLTRRGRLLASDVTVRVLAAGLPAGTR
ncbi:MAG: radical SAM family heme chaperone HemW [Acidimicrobiia bacterium]